LLAVLFLAVIAFGVISSGTMLREASQRRQEIDYWVAGHARQFARAGLVEATNWFRSQSSQPVTNFAPARDDAASPPITETVDPDIGLVREFRISGNVWGRYEVWKPWATDPDPERAARRRGLQVEDRSLSLGRGTPGVAWELKCRGLAYRRIDKDKAPDEPPNEVLAAEILGAELCRTITIKLPGEAAICIARGDQASIGAKALVEAPTDACGIGYAQGTGTPTVTGKITATQKLAALPAYDGSIQSVFGIALPQLRQQADFVAADFDELPDPLPEGSLVVVDPGGVPAVVDDKQKLRGRGVVVVTGSLTVVSASMADFSGLLYVAGDLVVQDGPCWLRGAVVIGGRLTTPGTRDWSLFGYDATVIDDLRRSFQYRIQGGYERQ
jgi:hypothetical protein